MIEFCLISFVFKTKFATLVVKQVTTISVTMLFKQEFFKIVWAAFRCELFEH
jgi:hypothetical protein